METVAFVLDSCAYTFRLFLVSRLPPQDIDQAKFGQPAMHSILTPAFPAMVRRRQYCGAIAMLRIYTVL
jgi:hypothetical protein